MKRLCVAVIGGLLVGAGFAFAQGGGRPPGPGNPTPGWEYGRLNCGPFSGSPPPSKPRTWEECVACCNFAHALDPMWFTTQMRNDCLTYCDWVHGRPATVTY